MGWYDCHGFQELRLAILVTGGAGFIGSNFVLEWLRLGLGPIVNLDKLTYAGNLRNLASIENEPDYSFVHADICDRDTVLRLLDEHRITAIVNFAAETHVDRSIHDPDEFLRTNVQGTFALLEAARTHYDALSDSERAKFRFINVSTDEVYGSLDPDEPAFNEDSPYRPNSPYSASKAAADHLCRSYFATYGLPVLTTNCSNNYGPFQFPEKLIPLIVRNGMRGEPLPVYGDGGNVRDWLYVTDHCAAIRCVLEAGRTGETYNIGGDAERTNIDVVEIMCDILDNAIDGAAAGRHRKLISFVTDRPGHDRRYAVDARKIREELGWRPTETFETGLQKTVQWYLDNEDWTNSIETGEYRDWLAANYEQRACES
jgi:dTDP-glucose 4,6-dehydratase